MDSEDETISIPDTEPDGTADCIYQGLTDTNITSTVELMNGLPVTNLTSKSAPVQRDDTPNPE